MYKVHTYEFSCLLSHIFSRNTNFIALRTTLKFGPKFWKEKHVLLAGVFLMYLEETKKFNLNNYQELN